MKYKYVLKDGRVFISIISPRQLRADKIKLIESITVIY
jgi:hypothetical protein